MQLVLPSWKLLRQSLQSARRKEEYVKYVFFQLFSAHPAYSLEYRELSTNYLWQAALVTYVTAGFPSLEETADILLGMEAGGAGTQPLWQFYSFTFLRLMTGRCN
jgi:Tryptophan synthase alpha chain